METSILNCYSSVYHYYGIEHCELCTLSHRKNYNSKASGARILHSWLTWRFVRLDLIENLLWILKASFFWSAKLTRLNQPIRWLPKYCMPHQNRPWDMQRVYPTLWQSSSKLWPRIRAIGQILIGQFKHVLLCERLSTFFEEFSTRLFFRAMAANVASAIKVNVEISEAIVTFLDSVYPHSMVC